MAATAPTFRTIVLANLGFFAAMTFWGGAFPAFDVLLRTWDALSATAGRHTVATVVLLVVLALQERRWPLRAGLPWRAIGLLGVVGMSITALLTTFSVQYSSGVAAAIASATNPITSAITARFLARAPLMPGMVIGATLSTIGGFVSIFGGGLAAGVSDFQGGEFLIILANLIWTWYSLMAQRWLGGCSQLQITGLTTMTGLFGIYAVLIFGGASGLAVLRFEFSLWPLLLLAYSGALSIGAGNFLWHYGVSRVGVTIGAMYANLIPVVAVVITFWMGAQPTWAQLVGGVAIIAGVLYAQVRAARTRRDHAAAEPL